MLELGEIMVVPLTAAMVVTVVGFWKLFKIRREWTTGGFNERQLLGAVFASSKIGSPTLRARARRWVQITAGAFLFWGVLQFAWLYGYF